MTVLMLKKCTPNKEKPYYYRDNLHAGSDYDDSIQAFSEEIKCDDLDYRDQQKPHHNFHLKI